MQRSIIHLGLPQAGFPLTLTESLEWPGLRESIGGAARGDIAAAWRAWAAPRDTGQIREAEGGEDEVGAGGKGGAHVGAAASDVAAEEEGGGGARDAGREELETKRRAGRWSAMPQVRNFFVDNVLHRIHFIVGMVW